LGRGCNCSPFFVCRHTCHSLADAKNDPKK
jgi:hypothetical protein